MITLRFKSVNCDVLEWFCFKVKGPVGEGSWLDSFQTMGWILKHKILMASPKRKRNSHRPSEPTHVDGPMLVIFVAPGGYVWLCWDYKWQFLAFYQWFNVNGFPACFAWRKLHLLPRMSFSVAVIWIPIRLNI